MGGFRNSGYLIGDPMKKESYYFGGVYIKGPLVS